jgi:hypothetical protein
VEAFLRPSVDVIVPCYRYGHFLEECVESVLSQDGVETRVLILDDASPDDTERVGTQLARHDSRVTFRRHSVNRGHIATYNEGIDWVSADYLLLLSADDYILPGALARATGVMEKAQHVGFVFGNALVSLEDGTVVSDHPLGKKPELKQDGSMDGAGFIAVNGSCNLVPAPTAVVRSRLQKELGGYRPELPHSGDMEMWLRLAAHASVGFVDDFQGVYRRHGANMSRNYSAGFLLPDLREKKAAIDYFLKGCGSVLRDRAAAERYLLRDLARQAVGRASIAFNEGDMEFTEKIARFARDLYPGIVRSWPWAKLAGKRTLGSSGWRAVNLLRKGVMRQSR